MSSARDLSAAFSASTRSALRTFRSLTDARIILGEMQRGLGSPAWDRPTVTRVAMSTAVIRIASPYAVRLARRFEPDRQGGFGRAERGIFAAWGEARARRWSSRCSEHPKYGDGERRIIAPLAQIPGGEAVL
jgi:hypothetical protein